MSRNLNNSSECEAIAALTRRLNDMENDTRMQLESLAKLAAQIAEAVGQNSKAIGNLTRVLVPPRVERHKGEGL
jgi:hypothetical protein